MARGKILIVEDEPAIAVDIALNLESNGFIIMDVVHSAEEAMELLEIRTPDLVMVDIHLEGALSGIDLARMLDQKYGIPFIYLTSYSDDKTIEQAAGTFPASYLVKPFRENDLAPAVKVALARKRGNRQARLPSLAMINKGLLSPITKGEYAIIEELWEGKTNLEIAQSLFLSTNTIKTHVRNLYAKLNVHSKPELLRFLQEL